MADDFAVGDSGNQSVFSSVIFVFVLNDEGFSGVVISFSLSSSSVFNLISFEISVVFD